LILSDLPERSAYTEMASTLEEELHQKIKALTGDTILDFGVYPDEC
jgi:hypothetical protein